MLDAADSTTSGGLTASIFGKQAGGAMKKGSIEGDAVRIVSDGCCLPVVAILQTVANV